MKRRIVLKTIAGTAAALPVARSSGFFNMNLLSSQSSMNQGIIPIPENLVMHLDASNTVSYPGSGAVWKNSISSPADGSSQTDWDFNINGPTFNGTAGTGFPSNYFSFGTNKYMIKGLSGNTFYNTMHWGTSEWTWSVIIEPLANPTSEQPIFCNYWNPGGAQGNPITLYRRPGAEGLGRMFMFWGDGTGDRGGYERGLNTDLSSGTFIITASYGGNGKETVYTCNDTQAIGAAIVNNDTSTAQTYPSISLGSVPAGGKYLADGAKIYNWMLWNKTMTAEQHLQLFEYYRGMFSL
jgi:hypothetical protein